MYDYLDIIHPQQEYPFQGLYLGARREFQSPFAYDIVERKSKAFQKLFANMQVNEFSSLAIQTDDDLNASVGDFIRLQDEKLYQIQSVAQDFSTGNKQVYRFLKEAPHCDFFYSLVEIQDIWQ